MPFLSSLPVDQEITVEPKFSAAVDGTPVELVAKAKPFKPTHESSLNLDIHGLDLTRYVDYVPGGLPVKLRAGRDRKSTRLNSSHTMTSRMPSSA